MKKPTPLAEKWKCVINNPGMHSSIDPWISTEWRRELGGKAPFGDLRNQWRKQHCRTLNPYGSEDCPFASSDCIRAFREAVEKTMTAHPRTPVGYFIKVARMDAARRADEGLTRRIGRRYYAAETNVPADQAPPEIESGHTGDEATGVQQRQGLRSPSAGPTGIGELLGALDIRPRELAAEEGEESTE